MRTYSQPSLFSLIKLIRTGYRSVLTMLVKRVGFSKDCVTAAPCWPNIRKITCLGKDTIGRWSKVKGGVESVEASIENMVKFRGNEK